MENTAKSIPDPSSHANNHWSLVRNDRGVPYIVADLLDKSARSSPDHDQSVIDDAQNGDLGAMAQVIAWIEQDSHCEETLLRAQWARHALAGNTFISIGYAEAHRGLTAERTSDGDYLVDCGSDYVLVAEYQWEAWVKHDFSDEDNDPDQSRRRFYDDWCQWGTDVEWSEEYECWATADE